MPATKTKPAAKPFDITAPRIAALVKSVAQLKTAPNDASLYDLGFTNDQLRTLQNRISKQFNKTVSTIFFQDTIYTLTDRLNENTKIRS